MFPMTVVLKFFMLAVRVGIKFKFEPCLRTLPSFSDLASGSSANVCGNGATSAQGRRICAPHYLYRIFKANVEQSIGS